MIKKSIVRLLLCSVTFSIVVAQMTDGCELPDSNISGFINLGDDGSVYYKTPEDIGGWQFDVVGTTVSSVSGGATETAGLSIQASGNFVLAFTFNSSSVFIPAGCGTLTELDLVGTATGLSEIVVSDTGGNSILFEYLGIYAFYIYHRKY